MKTVEMIADESRVMAPTAESSEFLQLPIDAQKVKLLQKELTLDGLELLGASIGFGIINVPILFICLQSISVESAIFALAVSGITIFLSATAMHVIAKNKKINNSIKAIQKENSNAIKSWLEKEYRIKLNEEELQSIATSVSTLTPTPTWVYKFSDSKNAFYNMKAAKDGRFYLSPAEDDWATPEPLPSKANNPVETLSFTGLSQDEQESVKAIESKLLALSKVANEVNTQKAAEQIREETYKALSLKEKLSHITSNPDANLIKDNLALLEGKLDELIQREAADCERQISTQLAYLEEGKTVKNSLTLNQSKAE